MAERTHLTDRLEALRNHFRSGATRPYAARREALKRLKRALLDHEEPLLEALHQDLRKPRFEGYLADVGLV
ncbi:MAG TPA: hypothetical protein PLA11_16460, partial [Flavobacteriales bacterium]|nr:hypothetical protein [Flavobacteriales bacterium]